MHAYEQLITRRVGLEKFLEVKSLPRERLS